MTEYLLIATHSGDWEIAKSDGTLKRGTSHYLVVSAKRIRKQIALIVTYSY